MSSDMNRSRVNVITPAFNEAGNLPVIYDRLRTSLDRLEVDWEWIVVDDHSTDGTPEVLAGLAERDRRVRGIRFSRNFGSHAAILCGLHQAEGDCAVILAADLQDPPEKIGDLLAEWRRGAHVVWAVRTHREGERTSTLLFSRLYYFLMRRTHALKDLPPTGADFFVVDRRVIDAVRRFRESHVSVFALITWMGFRRASIGYEKQARLHGRSGWTLQKKIKLFVDSVTAFTHFPIRVMSYLGFGTAFIGFLYAGFVMVNAWSGSPVPGWSSLMVVVLVLGGLQMGMLGVLGEYLWRALDEARGRPRYLIESQVPRESGRNVGASSKPPSE